jgi:uncharacterized membrane protein
VDLQAQSDLGKTNSRVAQASASDFAVTILPHRSLSQKSFRLVMTLVCLSTVVSSLPFIILGAWPVAGFFGLDLLALYIAFRVNFAEARAFEQVAVSRLEVLVRKVSHRGETREWRFNPVWTKIEENRHAEFGLQGLMLVSRGEAVPIAQALSPHERESFAQAFGLALAEARR